MDSCKIYVKSDIFAFPCHCNAHALLPEEAQDNVQDDTDDDARDDGKIETAVTSGNMDISGQMAQREKRTPEFDDDADDYEEDPKSNEHPPHEYPSLSSCRVRPAARHEHTKETCQV